MSIVFDSVSFRYDSKDTILDSINLEIKENDFVAILGKNGSGKTSLTYCINGLIPHAIPGKLTGNIYVDKENTKKISIGEISKKVGTVFQDPDLVIFNLTVYEEVSFGVYNLKLDHPGERVKKALETVGLGGFEKRDPQSLSGGQKQLLCIACVLAMGTDYIILDEPISSLDYLNAELIYKVLISLHKQGKTIIVIEHDTNMVWANAKKTMIINNHQIVKSGLTKQILKNNQELISFGIRPVAINL
ncbi:MAG: ABC transporter ATP-binding protein [Candidatus Roizmanbacteria bacterium]|nr:ABC transporter ATP-binding protein [Candidatus Roizmanbacteria bacterium]